VINDNHFILFNPDYALEIYYEP